MAKQIQFIDLATNTTDYITITDQSGQWYNKITPGFEVYNSSNWTSYAITATQFSTSKIYSADMPSVAANLYNIVAWVQAGGSAATSDNPIAGGQVEWDGTAVVYQGTAPSLVRADMAAIKTVTDQFHFTITNQVDANALSGVSGAVPTTAQIADKILVRNIDGGSDGGRTVTQALAACRNKVSFDVPSVGSFTVYDIDDVTPLWIGTYARGANTLGPLVQIDPS